MKVIILVCIVLVENLNSEPDSIFDSRLNTELNTEWIISIYFIINSQLINLIVSNPIRYSIIVKPFDFWY